MSETTNYQLHKWEPNDPVRLKEINDNYDAIDAALAGCGNCRIEAGTYTGTGVYGSNNKNTLTFSKQPLAVFIGGAGNTAILIRNNDNCITIDYNGTVRTLYLTWGADGEISWYSVSSAGYQMNSSGTVYTYFALLN